MSALLEPHRIAAPDATWHASADLVVVGSGVAGLTAALDATYAGLTVLVVTKGDADDANTYWAQGGVAVVGPVRDPHDSVDLHVQDTLVAGAGLCDTEAVQMIVSSGEQAIDRLVSRGAHFDMRASADAGGEPWVHWARTKEGGHSADRVIHAGGDATGAEIERALLGASRGLTILADHMALDVEMTDEGSAAGVTVIDGDGRVGFVVARAVLLATGGAGHLYAASTNPDVATADGLAMALRAGAVASDIEFVQFHPTVLYTGPGAKGHRPLVTEAVRGEGAVLVDATGARVMAGVHPLQDLAPRDVVSLAITRRLAAAPGGVSDHVFLDATSIAPDVFARRFPTVSAACRQAGIDPNTQPIPVTPAAHYHCGGVVTDLDGRTSIPGLYAAGEVARTGLHGANRLASNSLLEGLVMGQRVVQTMLADRPRGGAPATSARALGSEADPGEREALQALMSQYVAIGRDGTGLREVAARIADLRVRTGVAGSGDSDCVLASGPPTRQAVEATNLATVSAALVAAADVREESRGCHVRTDHPETEDAWRTSIQVRLVDGAVDARVDDRYLVPVAP